MNFFSYSVFVILVPTSICDSWQGIINSPLLCCPDSLLKLYY
ncbi:hypothetical protein ASZ90_020215 [hydrocarbon metagenome]|uniref:Uncharacterized protein n=1 Tax=hydrocarbon metagenome TaxID=938273 RepID=A0A0W8E1N6_9ZZZZ